MIPGDIRNAIIQSLPEYTHVRVFRCRHDFCTHTTQSWPTAKIRNLHETRSTFHRTCDVDVCHRCDYYASTPSQRERTHQCMHDGCRKHINRRYPRTHKFIRSVHQNVCSSECLECARLGWNDTAPVSSDARCALSYGDVMDALRPWEDPLFCSDVSLCNT